MRDLDADIDLRLPEIRQREVTFERALRDELASRDIGFIKLRPSIIGFPDRLALGHGKARLVEVKREGEDARRAQVARHEEFWRKYRIRVIMVEGPDVKRAATIVELQLVRGP